MKRKLFSNITAVMMAVVLSVSCLVLVSPAHGEFVEYLPGDVDGSGKINSRDYMMLKRYVLGTFELSEMQKLVADVDGNGKPASKDYMMLKRHILGTYAIPSISQGVDSLDPTDLFEGMSDNARAVAEIIPKIVEVYYGKEIDDWDFVVLLEEGRFLSKDELYGGLYFGKNDLEISWSDVLTLDDTEARELRSYLCYYFGSHDAQPIGGGSLSGTYIETPLICIDLKPLCELEKNRREMVDKIDSVIDTFKDGSEEELARQVCVYLAENVSYDASQSNATDALNSGRGSCNSHSILFRLFLHRLGIESDICVGFTSKGGYHAWNRVRFSDGTCKYYDVTYYASSKSSRYLGADSSCHNLVAVNRYLSNEELSEG